MNENIEPVVGEDNEGTPEVVAHAAGVLDLQSLKAFKDASDDGCFSLISYVNSGDTTA
ncbi:hypothetical protein ACIGZJ_15095 [Kitasatospora sp. NPDC052868]|uniref:hypothetical protein n=1 Tax=Kitasatospora sp. NPDC052868 TaxID=3364060 RepID=UPI0037C804C6